jgi:hypothetical protein
LPAGGDRRGHQHEAGSAFRNPSQHSSCRDHAVSSFSKAFNVRKDRTAPAYELVAKMFLDQRRTIPRG